VHYLRPTIYPAAGEGLFARLPQQTDGAVVCAVVIAMTGTAAKAVAWLAR
jgi:hypothetical protein